MSKANDKRHSSTTSSTAEPLHRRHNVLPKECRRELSDHEMPLPSPVSNHEHSSYLSLMNVVRDQEEKCSHLLSMVSGIDSEVRSLQARHEELWEEHVALKSEIGTIRRSLHLPSKPEQGHDEAARRERSPQSRQSSPGTAHMSLATGTAQCSSAPSPAHAAQQHQRGAEPVSIPNGGSNRTVGVSRSPDPSRRSVSPQSSTPAERSLFRRSTSPKSLPNSRATSKDTSPHGGSPRSGSEPPLDLYQLAKPMLEQSSSALEKTTSLRAVLECLKSAREPPNKWNGPGTPLGTAVTLGLVELSRLLLRARANADAQDDKGVTPLHLATFEGNLDICRLLLVAHADVNSQDRHMQSPLFFAPSCHVAELLWEKAADVSALNGKGQSAIHLAGRGGLHEVLSWLSTKVSKKLLELRDMHGITACEYAQLHSSRGSSAVQSTRAVGTPVGAAGSKEGPKNASPKKLKGVAPQQTQVGNRRRSVSNDSSSQNCEANSSWQHGSPGNSSHVGRHSPRESSDRGRGSHLSSQESDNARLVGKQSPVMLPYKRPAPVGSPENAYHDRFAVHSPDAPARRSTSPPANRMAGHAGRDVEPTVDAQHARKWTRRRIGQGGKASQGKGTASSSQFRASPQSGRRQPSAERGDGAARTPAQPQRNIPGNPGSGPPARAPNASNSVDIGDTESCVRTRRSPQAIMDALVARSSRAPLPGSPDVPKSIKQLNRPASPQQRGTLVQQPAICPQPHSSSAQQHSSSAQQRSSSAQQRSSSAQQPDTPLKPRGTTPRQEATQKRPGSVSPLPSHRTGSSPGPVLPSPQQVERAFQPGRHEVPVPAPSNPGGMKCLGAAALSARSDSQTSILLEAAAAVAVAAVATAAEVDDWATPGPQGAESFCEQDSRYRGREVGCRAPKPHELEGYLNMSKVCEAELASVSRPLAVQSFLGSQPKTIKGRGGKSQVNTADSSDRQDINGIDALLQEQGSKPLGIDCGEPPLPTSGAMQSCSPDFPPIDMDLVLSSQPGQSSVRRFPDSLGCEETPHSNTGKSHMDLGEDMDANTLADIGKDISENLPLEIDADLAEYSVSWAPPRDESGAFNKGADLGEIDELFTPHHEPGELDQRSSQVDGSDVSLGLNLESSSGCPSSSIDGSSPRTRRYSLTLQDGDEPPELGAVRRESSLEDRYKVFDLMITPPMDAQDPAVPPPAEHNDKPRVFAPLNPGQSEEDDDDDGAVSDEHSSQLSLLADATREATPQSSAEDASGAAESDDEVMAY